MVYSGMLLFLGEGGGWGVSFFDSFFQITVSYERVVRYLLSDLFS